MVDGSTTILACSNEQKLSGFTKYLFQKAIYLHIKMPALWNLSDNSVVLNYKSSMIIVHNPQLLIDCNSEPDICISEMTQVSLFENTILLYLCELIFVYFITIICNYFCLSCLYHHVTTLAVSISCDTGNIVSTFNTILLGYLFSMLRDLILHLDSL